VHITFLNREFTMNFQAGIKKENFMVAYEPEVAALHCLTIPANQVTLRTKDNIAMMFQPGCCFLVLDFGSSLFQDF
jgi:hypothetical protein